MARITKQQRIMDAVNTLVTVSGMSGEANSKAIACCTAADSGEHCSHQSLYERRRAGFYRNWEAECRREVEMLVVGSHHSEA